MTFEGETYCGPEKIMLKFMVSEFGPFLGKVIFFVRVYHLSKFNTR